MNPTLRPMVRHPNGNLPASLDEAIEKLRIPGGSWTDSPRLVVLGAMQNYIMITVQNGGLRLLANYKELNEIIVALLEMREGLSLTHVRFLYDIELSKY